MIPIVGQGTKRDPNSLDLCTRKRTHIDNEPRLEWAPCRLKSSIADYKKQHPDAVLRSITAIYNCLGLAFAARRTCIEPELTHMILREDGYSQLPSVDHAQIGDIVVYNHADEVAHVGIVVNIVDSVSIHRTLYVLSKWGPFGEYTHLINDVPPLFGKAEEFWTDRR